MWENLHFLNLFPRKRASRKRKKLGVTPYIILNPNGSIGKGHKANNPKLKEKCFHCGGARHWKRKCLTYLAQIKDSVIIESLVIEVSLITGTSNSWYVNFSTTNYICNMLQGFWKTKKLSDIMLHLGSEVGVAAVFVEVV